MAPVVPAEDAVSRQPRAGRAAHPVTVRATTAERAAWKRAARAEGRATLSAWVVMALNAHARAVLSMTPPTKSKGSGR